MKGLHFPHSMSRPRPQTWIAVLSAVYFACAAGSTLEADLATNSQESQESQGAHDAQVAELGAAAFYTIAEAKPRSKDAGKAAYASCVGAELDRALEGALRTVGSFAVVVFDVEEAGAFALPGGKVGLYSGLLPLLHNQDQLAAVFAHDLAHILSRHPNDRLVDAPGAKLGRAKPGAVVETSRRETSSEGALALAALGYGPSLETTQPYTFEQESEADALGLELMARAGFDPRQAVEMWKNLRRAPGDERPEYFRRHAHNERRIHRLYDEMGRVLGIYETVRDLGRTPSCKAPKRKANREQADSL